MATVGCGRVLLVLIYNWEAQCHLLKHRAAVLNRTEKTSRECHTFGLTQPWGDCGCGSLFFLFLWNFDLTEHTKTGKKNLQPWLCSCEEEFENMWCACLWCTQSQLCPVSLACAHVCRTEAYSWLRVWKHLDWKCTIFGPEEGSIGQGTRWPSSLLVPSSSWITGTPSSLTRSVQKYNGWRSMCL